MKCRPAESRHKATKSRKTEPNMLPELIPLLTPWIIEYIKTHWRVCTKSVKKNTKEELQNPFNQFFKILLCGSYRQIVFLCKPEYFHKHFLFPDQPVGNKISFGW